MLTAYFITSAILCIWMYRQTRHAAKSIRSNRRNIANPLD
ncbi:hypothetical protein SAMN05444358_1011523 [Ruegeria halocynthiae]|uniref:Uncharacterized protein n=1 Tax=Ruegeria halocynthiae TaxID=985054 RepID=A0A1H2VNL0_9RHOB|nr:hypothetical protein SAMN05444358_1011523 [Ruegeria halocynthiae]